MVRNVISSSAKRQRLVVSEGRTTTRRRLDDKLEDDCLKSFFGHCPSPHEIWTHFSTFTFPHPAHPTPPSQNNNKNNQNSRISLSHNSIWQVLSETLWSKASVHSKHCSSFPRLPSPSSPSSPTVNIFSSKKSNNILHISESSSCWRREHSEKKSVLNVRVILI